MAILVRRINLARAWLRSEVLVMERNKSQEAQSFKRIGNILPEEELPIFSLLQQVRTFLVEDESQQVAQLEEKEDCDEDALFSVQRILN